MSTTNQSDVVQTYDAGNVKTADNIAGNHARQAVAEEYTNLLIQDALDRYDLMFGETMTDGKIRTVDLNICCSSLCKHTSNLSAGDSCRNGQVDIPPSGSSSVTLTCSSSGHCAVQSYQSCATLTQESEFIHHQQANCISDERVSQDFHDENTAMTGRQLSSGIGSEGSPVAPASPCTDDLSVLDIHQSSHEFSSDIKLETRDSETGSNGTAFKADDNNNQQISLSAACTNDAYNRVGFIHHLIEQQQQKSRQSGIRVSLIRLHIFVVKYYQYKLS